MAYRPLDIANGKDSRNRWKVVLFKNGEGEIEHTSLFYTTKEKAEEIASYLNNTLGTQKLYQQYVVRPHDPTTYVSYRKR